MLGKLEAQLSGKTLFLSRLLKLSGKASGSIENVSPQMCDSGPICKWIGK